MGWTQKQTASHPFDLRYGTVMLPPTAHDHEPLPVIFENLQQLSVRTKCEFEQDLKDYAATQA